MSSFDRPGRANVLLHDPLFVEAFETVEKAIHDKWAATPIRDTDGAHELKLMLKLLKDVKLSIEKVALEGKAELHRAKQPSFLGDITNSWKSNRRANKA